MLTPGSKLVKKKLFQGATLQSLFLIIFGLRRLCQVDGDSMLPTLRQGDIVLYRPVDPENFVARQGSIVVVQNPQDSKGLIIKRIHKENTLGLDLRGDNEENSIDSRQFGLVNYNCLRGIVEHIIFQPGKEISEQASRSIT